MSKTRTYNWTPYLFALAIKLRLICKYNDFNSISIIVVFDKKSTLWNLPAFVMVII